MREPFCPPPRDCPARRLPGGFELGVENFAVEEVPAYAPSGDGEHVFAWVQKRGLSTMYLVDRLASALGCSPRDIGYAGLKDRHATTRQWLSFQGLEDPDRLRDIEIEGFDVLSISRHDNKLKTGHLRGNRFRIELPCAAGCVEDVRQNLGDLERVGVPNYFGAQRFGSGGRNLDKGLRLLKGNPRRAARRVRKPLLRLLLSSVQSEVFNRVLAARRESVDRLEDGDVAWLHHNGASFLVTDARTEQVRCQRFELSPSGPLPGPKCLAAAGAQGELEAAVLRELEIDPDWFGKYSTNPGERRPLRTRLREPRVTEIDAGVRIEFELDRGAFATTVLRQLVAEPPWIESAGDVGE